MVVHRSMAEANVSGEASGVASGVASGGGKWSATEATRESCWCCLALIL